MQKVMLRTEIKDYFFDTKEEAEQARKELGEGLIIEHPSLFEPNKRGQINEDSLLDLHLEGD